MMSEDEIIKYIKNEIEIDIDTRYSFKNNKESPVYKDLDECIKAHQGLLDLYQKEKEKNKELENDLTTVYMNGFYDAKNKYKDKIKEFYKKYLAESMKNFSPYVKDESTPPKERKAGQLRILYNLEKELLKEEK